MGEGRSHQDGSANSAHRNAGRLHNHSVLHHHDPFNTSGLVAGTTFEADLRRLLTAVQKWEECLDSFTKTLAGTALSTTIRDGTGPVAHVLGARFNHRIGAHGGIGYAATAYVRKLEQILAGLTQTADNIAQTDESAAAGLTEGR